MSAFSFIAIYRELALPSRLPSGQSVRSSCRPVPSTFALRSPRSSLCGSGRGNQRRRVAFTGNGDDATGCRFGGNIGGATETQRNVEREEAEAAGSGDG